MTQSARSPSTSALPASARNALDAAMHALLFFGALALYAGTMHGDVQPADSGEFQIAAITLGIAHPPGYPLFTLLGWLFSLVPVGSPFARVTFLSVVASAATLVIVSLGVRRAVWAGAMPRDDGGSTEPVPLSAWAAGLLAGLVAAVALGASTTFWAQATTTNIRSLTALFTALMLHVSARAYATRRRVALVWFAVAFGLGVGHHVSLVFVGAVLGLYVVWVLLRHPVEGERWTLRRAALLALGAFALTQLVWLYLPLRDAAGATFAPGNLTTLDGLLFHIFARGFAGDMLAFAAPAFLADRLALLPTLLEFQFSLPLLLAMGFACAVLLAQRASYAVAWLAASALHLFITITYRAPQTVEYALPSWVFLCALLGAGLGALGRGRQDGEARHGLLTVVPAVLLLLALALAIHDGAARWPSYAHLAADRSTRAAAEAVLRSAMPAGVVHAQWHQATPMWALQRVEGLGPGVDVRYVFPRGAEPYPETFARQAASTASAELTYVTSYYEDALAAQQLESSPLPRTPGWRVAPSIGAPGGRFDGITFDERIRVAGPPGVNGQAVEAGASVPIDVSWSTEGPHKPGDSITVRVMRPDGRLAANADLRIPPGAEANHHHVKRLALGLPFDLPPGQYDLLVGAYQAGEGGVAQYTDESGREFVPVAKLDVVPAALPPGTQRPMSVAIGDGGPRLIGLDYDTGMDGQLRAWTHWRLGAQPLEVALTDAAGQLLAASKVVPTTATPDRPAYLSVPFDIPPTREVRLSPGGVALPGYAAGERYVPFSDQMALVRADARRSAGDAVVDLHWLSARPIVDDYVVSARLEGDGAYRAHDGVPALGAVPTLKWIAGSRVMDRHPIDLGDYRGPLRGSVVVYDSVTRLPLAPLDERYEGRVSFTVP